MTLANRQVLHDRYRVDALLGQGGMGAVYKAWDQSLNIPVAVKENLDASEEAQAQFGREAHILASLSHPNLPRVTDTFFIPGQGQYLVMDYVEGEDLQSMLNRMGNLPQTHVLGWILQICDALAYLHSQPAPIIHRDIKPSNIRIRPDGRAMLVDFGIAKVFNPTLMTTVGARAVTPGYSPPEQYGGGSTDPRSDVYALGATLFHLLSGHKPPESVQRLVNQASLPPLCQGNSQVSPVVEQVIHKATEISTSKRFQTMAELRAALTQSQSVSAGGGAPPQATIYPPTQPPTGTQKTAWETQPPRTGPRRSGLRAIGLLGVGGLLVLLVGGGGLALLIGFMVMNPGATATPPAANVAGAATQTELPAVPTALDDPAAAQPADTATSPPAGTRPVANMDSSMTPVAGKNMLKNGSFEHEPGSEPPYWIADPLDSDLASSWSTERVLTGQHALFLSASRTEKEDGPGWFTTIPLVPDFHYTFDARYFTPDGAGAQITVDFLNEAGDILHTIGTTCTQPKNLTVWRPARMNFVPTDVPRGTANIRLGLRQCLDYTRYKRTTLFYDDVSLIPAAP